VSEFHTKAPQATASEGLVQGPYVATRAGFEPLPFGQKAMNLPMSHHYTRDLHALSFVFRIKADLLTYFLFANQARHNCIYVLFSLLGLNATVVSGLNCLPLLAKF